MALNRRHTAIFGLAMQQGNQALPETLSAFS